VRGKPLLLMGLAGEDEGRPGPAGRAESFRGGNHRKLRGVWLTRGLLLGVGDAAEPPVRGYNDGKRVGDFMGLWRRMKVMPLKNIKNKCISTMADRGRLAETA